ncbi:hypothetical protein BO70DRAFT_367153 [Aspergillus heteromorphus CBS 117.55]|uniref:DAGKc domain-containing protein n=1 Tax=Aspergillus heteromorphus CBS 117.55 TaxID=1448321 RepID=A0A317USX2_9EURO|nr:uncharacterized protein BO70DRAFT_367153 [Aspergillus heteromorphus CBS 117.55]PWY63562.1 hypothetical protein BO70DRAFT_367153 [Aspergillus heteromorphus CBS 117.55]
MASTLDADATDDECFNYVISGDSLRCRSEQPQKEFTIALGSIICIIPKEKYEGTVYILLFLQVDGNEDFDPRSPCTLLGSVQLATVPSSLSHYLWTHMPHHLCAPGSEARSIDIVISTVSGTGTGQSFYSNILQPLLSHIGVTGYELHETKSTQTITELCHARFIPRAGEKLPQTIILLSGDGGLTDIIDAFHSTVKTTIIPPTIALIPTGTGNAMANSLGSLAYPAKGLVALLQGVSADIPTFAANFSPGARYITDEGRGRASIAHILGAEGHHKIYGGVVASWGVHAALVADSDTIEYRKFGADRFKLAAKEILFPSNGAETHKFLGAVTLFKWDNQAKNRREEILGRKEHMYVLATLVSSLEKDFMISPLSKPLDGGLWIIHFGPMSPTRVLEVMSSAYKGGQHVKDESVFYDQIEGFRIEFCEEEERWRRVCIDGKIIAVEAGGWMEVHKEPKSLLKILLLGNSPCANSS